MQLVNAARDRLTPSHAALRNSNDEERESLLVCVRVTSNIRNITAIVTWVHVTDESDIVCVMCKQVFGTLQPLSKAAPAVAFEAVTAEMKGFKAYAALREARTDARMVGIRKKKAAEKKEAEKDADKKASKADEVGLLMRYSALAPSCTAHRALLGVPRVSQQARSRVLCLSCTTRSVACSYMRLS